MSGAYLPGDTRQRIQDLIKDSSITQAELAGIIGLSESALSRYLKGQTEMLGDGYIIKIAKHFRVSTDFLLGETDIPDRKNYNIEELGLSVRSYNCLKRSGITVVSDLEKLSRDELLSIKNLGASSADEILNVLKDFDPKEKLEKRLEAEQEERERQEECAARILRRYGRGGCGNALKEQQ